MIGHQINFLTETCGRMVFGTDQSAVGGESEKKSL